MRLAPHFVLAEFVPAGQVAPRGYVRGARRLCREYLEPLRAEFGAVTISSGYRSPQHNRRVGGAPQSLHLGRHPQLVAAADVVCRRGTPREWYELLDRLGIGGLGLYRSHVHADNRGVRARW